MASIFSTFKRGEGVSDMQIESNRFEKFGRFMKCHMWFHFFNESKGQLKAMDGFEKKYHSSRMRLAPMLQIQLFQAHQGFLQTSGIGLSSASENTRNAPDCTISPELLQFMSFFESVTKEINGRYEQFESK